MLEIVSPFDHPEVPRHLAWVDGHAAGGGACWEHDRILGIFGCATLAAGRRRGV